MYPRRHEGRQLIYLLFAVVGLGLWLLSRLVAWLWQ